MAAAEPLLTEPSKLTWDGEVVPNWAYEKEALEIVTVVAGADNWRRGAVEDFVVGPGIPIAFRANGILWLVFLAFPWFALPFMTYAEGGRFATYPSWILFPFALIVVGLLRLEFEVAKLTLVPQVLLTGPAKFCGFAIPFYVWLPCTFFYSFISHFDIGTTSLFLAKTWKTEQCSTAVETIWHKVLQELVWASVPLLDSACFSTLVFFAWKLMPLQVLYALGQSIPINKNCGSYGEFNYARRPPDAGCANYDTLLRAKQWHGRALQALADSSRMRVVAFKSWSYFMDVASTDHTYGGWPKASLYAEMRRYIMKFAVFLIAQSVFQPALQASAFAIGIAASGGHDFQLLLSIALNLITTSIAVYTESQIVFALWRMARVAPDSSHRVNPSTAKLNGALLLHVSLVGFAVCLIGIAFVRTFMAQFVCKYGVWNLNGCAHPFSS